MMVVCPYCRAAPLNCCLSKTTLGARVNSRSGRQMYHRARIELAVRTIKIEHWRREQAVRALAAEPPPSRDPRRPFVVPNAAWIANPVTKQTTQVNAGDRIYWENGRVVVRDANGQERT